MESYQFIQDLLQEDGITLTYRTLAYQLNISLGKAKEMLTQLIETNLIVKESFDIYYLIDGEKREGDINSNHISLIKYEDIEQSKSLFKDGFQLSVYSIKKRDEKEFNIFKCHCLIPEDYNSNNSLNENVELTKDIFFPYSEKNSIDNLKIKQEIRQQKTSQTKVQSRIIKEEKEKENKTKFKNFFKSGSSTNNSNNNAEQTQSNIESAINDIKKESQEESIDNENQKVKEEEIEISVNNIKTEVEKEELKKDNKKGKKVVNKKEIKEEKEISIEVSEVKKKVINKSKIPAKETKKLASKKANQPKVKKEKQKENINISKDDVEVDIEVDIDSNNDEDFITKPNFKRKVIDSDSENDVKEDIEVKKDIVQMIKSNKNDTIKDKENTTVNDSNKKMKKVSKQVMEFGDNGEVKVTFVDEYVEILDNKKEDNNKQFGNKEIEEKVKETIKVKSENNNKKYKQSNLLNFFKKK
ncbi:hypothetical protein K502DRAFT_352095 [Neoconidiobolus thromboides FSU 785]|nr:hypothetical protein K502DRAFT_352095 [Neoconidiobolus thromboides FSU 785]